MARWLLLALGLLVATEVRAEDVQLRLWHAYSGSEEASLRSVVSAFEQSHPGRRVELLANAFGGYQSKIETTIPSGRGPDVFIEAHERLQTYVSRRLIRSLSVDAALLHREALSFEGRIYGVPLSMKAVALYLDNDLVPNDPTSLDALIQATLPAGVYPLAVEAENAYFVAPFLHAEGGRLLDGEGQYSFVGASAERAVRWLQDVQERGKVPREATGALIAQLFENGRAAAVISGPWFVGTLSRRNFRVIPLPPLHEGGAPMVPFVTLEAAYVSQHSDHPQEAEGLAGFLASDAAALIFAREGQQIPTNARVYSQPDLQEDAFLAAFRSAADAGLPMPIHANMPLVFVPAQRSLRRAFRGGDVADSLAAGLRSFRISTRPFPAKQKPTLFLLVIGGLLSLLTWQWLRHTREHGTEVSFRESLPAYRYVAHAFLAVLLLVFVPILVGIGTSFFAGRGDDLFFVGTANYRDILTGSGGGLFASGSFWIVLLVTVLWTVSNLVLHVGIGVALALILHRSDIAMRGWFRVLLVLPWAVPNYVTALAWKGLFHFELGAINAVLRSLHVEPINFFSQFSTAFAANLTTNVWLGFPFMMVIALGALSQIPNELYQAAAVDGASSWQMLRTITLPMLRPIMAPSVAMGAVWTFNMFNVVHLVSSGEPDGTTEILVSEAYRWAFTRGNQYGYASAYAVLIFLLLLFATNASRSSEA